MVTKSISAILENTTIFLRRILIGFNRGFDSVFGRYSHSLQWRLQAWHAFILFLAVAGFGTVLYWQLATTRWDEVDSELISSARILEGAMLRVPLPILESLAKEIGHNGPMPAPVFSGGGPGRFPPPLPRPGPGSFYPDPPFPNPGPYNDRPNVNGREFGRQGGNMPTRSLDSNIRPSSSNRRNNQPSELSTRPPMDGDSEGQGSERALQAEIDKSGQTGMNNDIRGNLVDKNEELLQDDRRDRNGRPDFVPGRGSQRGGFRWDPRLEPFDQNLSPEDRNGWEQTLVLPRSLPQQLGRNGEPAYFIIWRQDSSVMRSAFAPSATMKLEGWIRTRLRRDGLVRQQQGPYRSVYIHGPQSTVISVGRRVDGESARLMQIAGLLFFTGSLVIACGLFGGWRLSKSAVDPIAKMSETASQISAKNLAVRMDLDGLDDELKQLGGVLNAMLDRIDHAFEDQRRFTADASHELRTPLSVILSSTELALLKERSPEEYVLQLEKCGRSAIRMRKLVESMLTLARLDDGLDQSMVRSDLSVNLGEVVCDAISTLKSRADEAGVTIKSKLDQVTATIDPLLLYQVISNLISNAIQYNRPQGSISVHLFRQEGLVVIKVDDTGVGIPASAIPHLFDRFYRVDKSRSQACGGCGLGLSICKRIVDLYGGTILVESVENQGSTFTVRLPAFSELLVVAE